MFLAQDIQEQKEVAVKFLKKTASNDERDLFLGEAVRMKDLKHPNVVQLLGVVSLKLLRCLCLFVFVCMYV